MKEETDMIEYLIVRKLFFVTVLFLIVEFSHVFLEVSKGKAYKEKGLLSKT